MLVYERILKKNCLETDGTHDERKSKDNCSSDFAARS